MRVKQRLVIALAGAIVSLYGLGMMQRGHFIYQNRYSMTLYSPGVIAIGVFLFLLAFLPPASWVYRLVGKRKHSNSHKRRPYRE